MFKFSQFVKNALSSALNFQIVCLCLVTSPQSASGQQQLVEWSGTTMGPIEYKVIVAVDEKQDVTHLPDAVSEALESINRMMSTYQPDSEVSRFNRSESLDWFPVTSETLAVVERAQEVSRRSDGAFDITVKPLVELWNFGAGRGEFQVPSDEAISERLAQVGYQFLETKESPPAIRKLRPGIQIDLSAIAKGYAVDRAGAVLEQHKIVNYFVEVGGEVVCRGEKKPGVAWRVGIERPTAGIREVHVALALRDRAVATSGNYRNFYDVDGHRYSHTIQPKTGRPVEHGLTSVSVIASDCMTADALATAVMVLGQELGWKLCQTYDAALMTIEDVDGQWQEWQSPNFVATGALHSESSDEFSVWGILIGTLFVFVLAVGAMAVGVIAGRKPIRGSCGGLSAGVGGMEDNGECGVCHQDTSQCEQQVSDSV